MDKRREIIWSELGITSFEGIISYIALDSPYYASNFAKKILKSIEKISFFPKLGRIVPECNNENIRELIYQNYRIVYNLDVNSLTIVYIGHSSKQLPNIQ